MSDELELSPKASEFLQLFPNTLFVSIPEGGEDVGGNVQTSTTLNLDLNTQGYGLFFSVNGFSEGRRLQNYLSNLNAVFCDIDYPLKDGKVSEFQEEVVKELCVNIEMIPTAIVFTKNGLHVYWVLDQPIFVKNILNENERDTIIQSWRKTTEGIIERFNADPQAKDVTRVLRIPESIHLKDPLNPYFCKLHFFNPENKFTLSQLEKYFSKSPAPDEWAIAQSNDELSKETKKKINEKYPKLDRPSFQQLIDPSFIVPEGKRNQTLLVVASACREDGWSKEKTIQHFANYHGLSFREIQRTINSAYAHEYDFGYNNDVIAPLVSREERAKLSEITSAILSKESKEFLSKKKSEQKELFLSYEEEIAKRYPHLKYKMGSNLFYNYDEKRGVYKSYDEEHIIALFLAEMNIDGLKEYRKVACVRDKMACFKSLLGKTFYAEQENPDKNIMNLKNGLLNIKTFERTPHTPDYISTTQIPIEYDKGARCPRWLQFLEECMEGDKEQVRLLRQFCGYCLTPDVEFQKAFMFLGPGRNGKGTFTRILENLVGFDSTVHVKLKELNGNFGLEGVVGKRLDIIDEISENYFESDIIKGLISGERMTASQKYKSSVEFRSTLKVLFTVNRPPKVNDTSEALYERFIIVDWKKMFRNPDTQLEQKLMQELPGILNDSVEALKDLRSTGRFSITSRNSLLLNEFKAENSPVIEFLRNYFEQAATPEERMKWMHDAFELYKLYDTYSRDRGYKAKNYSNFIREIEHIYTDEFKGLTRLINRQNGKACIAGLRPIRTINEGFRVVN